MLKNKFGFSHLYGYFGGDDWVMYRTDFYIKDDLEDLNVCFNVVLHELLHCVGLAHNDVPGSVMNNSVMIDKGSSVVPSDKWTLSLDDVMGIYASSTRLIP